MNEFKFSCPNCQQKIEATPEYSGAQINCPACQHLLTVPPAPSGPVPPQVTKLTKAPSTVNRVATPTPFIVQGRPVKKKKDRTGLVVGLILAAGAISAGINFGPSLYAKYFHHEEASAADQGPTNAPPPPPPELTSEEILQKVGETYTGLKSFALKGQSVMMIDVSQINPAMQGEQRSTATVALQLGRSNLYRMEWERTVSGTPIKGAAWSAGKGDFFGFGPYPPGKVKNREEALTKAAAVSSALCSLIAELFFSETNNLATQASAFTRTNGTALSGQDCYILNGELAAHNIVLWINKRSFLIPQIEFDFGGKVDEAALKKLPPAERDQLTRMSKLKGNVVETYENLESNPDLSASAFESSYTPSAAATAAPGGRPALGPKPGSPEVGGRPTQLTRRVRPPPQ
ncbi:MAG: hypothetical protein ABSH38_11280 [Verrucomicrobiota bacterium]|jgi:hypothetical protein